MATIEEFFANVDGDWGGIEQVANGVRMGFSNNFVVVERTLPSGEGTGIYPLPFIASEEIESFLAWRVSLKKEK